MKESLYIPPNYDSAKYKLLGWFSLSALIEAAVCSIIFFIIVRVPASYFSNGIIAYLTIIVLTAVVFFILLLIAEKESLVKRLKRLMRFMTTRRVLKFRRIKHRKKIALPPILQKEYGIDGGTLASDDPEENEEEETQSELKKLQSELLESFKIQEVKARKQDYTQEFLNVESIEDGFIKRKDGSFVKIIELSAINFNNLKEEDELQVLGQFLSFLKIGPVYTQFKVMSFKPDLSEYILNFREKSKHLARKNPNIQRFIDEIAADLEFQSQYGTIDHKYFLIMSYKPKMTGEDGKQEAYNELLTYAANARSKFESCGNDVVYHEDENIFLYENLYRFFNRRSSEIHPFAARYNRVRRDTAKARGISLNQPIIIKPHNLLAPRSIDLSNSDYIYMDGLYYTFMLFDDFPADGVPAGWLKRFSNVGEGFDFDIISRREVREQVRAKVNNKINSMEGDAPNMPSNSQAARDMYNVLDVTENYILKSLNEGQDLFNFIVVISIFSRSYEDLMKRRRWIKDYCTSANYSVKPVNYQHEDVFAMTAPLCEIRNGLFEDNRRNALGEGIASLYPLTTTTVNELNGISLGISMDNSAPVIFDPFKPISNMLVFGVTSYGKSYTTMLLSTRLFLMQGTQVFVISPSKGHEYIPIVRELGGVHVQIGPGHEKYINIMEVRPAVMVSENTIDESDVFSEMSFLADKIQDLMKFFKLACPTMSQKQRDMLNPELMKLYKKFGITDDNNSVFINNDRSTNELKEMPIIEDLYVRLKGHRDPELQELSKSLNVLVEGNLNYFNHQTNVDLDNMFCVLDLESVRKTDYYPLALFVAQSFVWRKVKANRTQKKCILLEEMWQLLNNEESAELIKEIAKTIRGYGGIMVGITQNIHDLTNIPQGEAILDNAITQIIMRLAPNDALEAKQRFNLSQAEYSRIVSAKKGEALICTPKDHYPTLIRASSSEAEMFETDREKLESNYLQKNSRMIESGEAAS